MKGPSILRLGFLILFSLLAVGCRLHQYSEEAPVKGEQSTTDHHGYALLFALLGEEKNVAKLMVIKRERAELRELVQAISETAARGHRDLENLAKADRSVNLHKQGLPTAESAARASITRAKGKDLLIEGAKEFELQLLLSQNEALTYGMHLAEAIAKAESNPVRARYLQQLAGNLRQLQGKVLAMLLANYTWTKPT
jgi:hypothetical protein